MKTLFIGFYLLIFHAVFSLAQNIQEEVVKDVDGNVYRTKNFGGVSWMLEDLKVTRYRNGQKISFSNSSKVWSEHNRGIARHVGDKKEGVFYNWYVVIDVRKVCPTGWKVPSENEWNNLGIYLETIQLKDSLTQKNSAFIPRYNGNFDVLSTVSSVRKSSYWWSFNENSELSAWGREMTLGNFRLLKGHADKRDGMSVRCIKEKN